MSGGVARRNRASRRAAAKARAARPLAAWRWLGLPLLAVVLATLLFAVPLRVAGLSLPEPVFAAAPAFAWALTRPAVGPPFAVLSAGLFLDLFWGTPMGLWGGSLLIVYAAGLAGRKYLIGQPALVLFAWWTGAVAVMFLGAWAITTLDTGSAPAVLPVVWQLVATLALYPVAAYLTARYSHEARAF